MNCRHCNTPLQLPFIDLGSAPPSNNYLSPSTLSVPELWFPLRVMVCEKCWLVQTEDFSDAKSLFSADYAYFSSFSRTWLAHAKQYVTTMINRFSLNPQSMVVEIAANDGYLLQYVRKSGIPCLGVEPTTSTATAARDKGISIVEDFFNCELANKLRESGYSADLMVANNVLAHVPDINDFVQSFGQLLKPHGVATFEFPHLLRLVEGKQFDTIYHEHYSYLSFTAIEKIFSKNSMSIFDVEEIDTHGGSLRIYVQRSDLGCYKTIERVSVLQKKEKNAGITEKTFYQGAQQSVEKLKNDLLTFLLTAKQERLTVAAYGAAAKGNTLLNFAGIRPDLISFIVDRNPAKQGKFMPGSRIAIVDETELHILQPERVLILPWNLRDEISDQLSFIRQWNGKFVTAVPQLEIF